MDYFNVRRLMPGDPVKRINWKASARHPEGSDELLVNEFVAEVGAEVLIVVDPGRATGTGQGRDPVMVHSVRAAISIAERLLHDRNRVGLLTTGAEPRRIAAGYGRRQFDRIALSVLQLEPGGSDIEWWVERSIHLFFPNISQIVFISPLMDTNSISAAAELTRDGERDVIVVSPNPVALCRAQIWSPRLEGMANRPETCSDRASHRHGPAQVGERVRRRLDHLLIARGGHGPAQKSAVQVHRTLSEAPAMSSKDDGEDGQSPCGPHECLQETEGAWGLFRVIFLPSLLRRCHSPPSLSSLATTLSS